MKILLVHNHYQSRGGEDDVLENEFQLLRQNGQVAKLFRVHNEQIRGAFQKVKTAWQLPYSMATRNQLRTEIASFAPDVVHVHNFFPILTPSIYDACRDAAVPVVQTLHNYRLVCSGALLMRNNKPCEKCVLGSHYWAVVHKCYRGSALASLAVARMGQYHRKRQTWQEKVDCYIALTEFMKGKFVAAGFPPEKIAVKPNFVPDPVRQFEAGDETLRHGALFAGRLSPEKGVRLLLTAWSELDVPLRILGDGPLLDVARNASRPGIEAVGRVGLAELSAEMHRAQFLVMPSTWYEGFPMTIVQAFACGLPVIVPRLGSMEELIDDGETGLHFTTGDTDDLVAKVRWAAANPGAMLEMGHRARQVYEERYLPEKNYEKLMEIYNSVGKLG